MSGGTLYARYVTMHLERSDLSQVLFGARAILHGANPYNLIGPGLAFDLKWGGVYPATAYVATIPLSFLSDIVASSAFVGVSTFILAFSSTKDSWHRLPLFPSIAFASSVQFAQWSIFMTSILFLPWLALIAAIKPQSAIPIVTASANKRTMLFAIAGGVVLLILSLILLPGWPRDWIDTVRASSQLRPPILRLGGFLIAFVLLRWRRSEAWLVFLMACMPQTWAWYNVLPLLVIATTYKEAAVLSIISSTGALLAALIVGDPTPERYAGWGAAMVTFAYLPAVIVVLKRPNQKELAPWGAGIKSRRLSTTMSGGR
ncbi:MAG TPA: hypothetical protein VM099_03390 [Gemmatimonadaceae bacterium]|nr:hypothetical protein [Gemmatimonadaceae bacterium]